MNTNIFSTQKSYTISYIYAFVIFFSFSFFSTKISCSYLHVEQSDHDLGIPGEHLTNVISARAFVNWYNGHPNYSTLNPNLLCETAVIIGQGNVAIDCARILSKTTNDLEKTDIAKHALEALSER